MTKFYYKNPNAPRPNKPNHIGVTAIILNGDSILMDLRADSNRWALIGGALELDESLADGLKREIFEETSLQVEAAELFGMFSDPSRRIEYPDGNVVRSITIAFIVQVDGTAPLVISEESRQLKFVKVHELPEYDIVETHRHIVESYLSWDRTNVIVE